MRGSRDICYRYYTRFSHRARDDVLPGTETATSIFQYVNIVCIIQVHNPCAHVRFEITASAASAYQANVPRKQTCRRRSRKPRTRQARAA